MRPLRDAIELTSERLTRLRRHTPEVAAWYRPTTLVEPLIEALGWDVSDPDEVRRGYRFRSEGPPVDYALLVRREAHLFVGVGANLDDEGWTNQVLGQATQAGVYWVVLTDGSEWRVYNLHAASPLGRRRFRSVRIDADADRVEGLLRLLTKSAVAAGDTEEMWRRHFIDQRVGAELLKLFAGDDPVPGLVALIADGLPSVDEEDVQASLRRVRAVFDFPAPERAAEPEREADPAPEPEAEPVLKTEAVRAPKKKVSSAERRIRMAELIAEGRLSPGTRLEGTYARETHHAELLDDGRILYQGESFTSPSGAGAAVKIAVRGPETPESVYATDGYEFWRATDAIVGDVVPLKEIRRRVVDATVERPL